MVRGEREERERDQPSSLISPPPPPFMMMMMMTWGSMRPFVLKMVYVSLYCYH